MAKKVVIQKKVKGSLEQIYPQTSANNVIMSSGKTVEETIAELNSTIATLSSSLTALTTKVNTMYDKLEFETVYSVGSNGSTLTDGSELNLGLVAVY